VPCGANSPGRSVGAVLSPISIGYMSTPLLTADEVATLLGVPKSWVYEQSRQGLIPTVPLGRNRRFRREAIEAWVERLEGVPRSRAA
jgi:excisionase family DNA binding protein